MQEVDTFTASSFLGTHLLQEARLLFRQLLSDSTQKIDALSKKLGKCVQQARPYYEARIKAKQVSRNHARIFRRRRVCREKKYLFRLD